MSDNASGAGNQQETKHSTVERLGSSETIRRAPLTKEEIIAYLNGAAHDATLNKGRRIRFAQKHKTWLETLQRLLSDAGYNSWIYREGRKRNVFVLETLCSEIQFNFDPTKLGEKEKIMYLKGFFDAEGGVPRNDDRFYVQLAQKDKQKIRMIKGLLSDIGISCGKIHNPSRSVDANYWRVYVRADSHGLFANTVGSYHPIKAPILRERVKR